jgi:uncharacterized protein YigA (DUF484 family)
MTQQAEEPRDPAEAIAESAVAAYLAANPSFFQRHPDLVAELKVPHSSGGAVSLIERQVDLLRDRLETERRRLAHLIARARDFETLSGHLHRISLQLIAAPDLERVQTVLHEALCRDLNADAVSLKLFPVGPETGGTDPTVNAFLDLIDREHCLCGPLDAERSAVLFGEQSENVHSAAIIPVRADARSGILAIGSRDPERFGPDMGTDLLDRLGQTVGQKLRVLHEAHE